MGCYNKLGDKMINYNGLNVELAKKKITREDLRTALGMGSATLSRMTNNKYVSTETIDKICDFLDCQPADIMIFERVEPTKEIKE